MKRISSAFKSQYLEASNDNANANTMPISDQCSLTSFSSLCTRSMCLGSLHEHVAVIPSTDAMQDPISRQTSFGSTSAACMMCARCSDLWSTVTSLLVHGDNQASGKCIFRK